MPNACLYLGGYLVTAGTCMGDSGGPLFVTEEGKYILTGGFGWFGGYGADIFSRDFILMFRIEVHFTIPKPGYFYLYICIPSLSFQIHIS